MANLDFYAIGQDIIDTLEFIFTETDCKVFESYSEHGKDLREFKSMSECFTAYNYEFAGSFLLQLWSPSVASKVFFKRIDLDPKKCNGATFRFRVDGWGLMQLYLGRAKDQEIEYSHFGHNSESRAKRWEPTYIDELGLVDDWDWQLLKKISGKIQYHIRKRLAVSKVNSRPILAEASKKHLNGYKLKYLSVEDSL